MQRIAVFRTEDGGEVAIQVADDPQAGAAGTAVVSTTGAPPGLTVRGIPDEELHTRGIPTGRLVERSQQTLEEVLAHAMPAVTTLVAQMRRQDDPPHDLDVEFGIQISLGVGAYIAQASSTANFRVTMHWHSPAT